jgi:glycosyltransferase involved in cell wall biosynthesis
MKNFLVVHPSFDVIGGAEIVALHIIDFLANRVDGKLSLLTLRPVNWTSVFSRVPLVVPTEKIENPIAKCPSTVLKRKGKLELLKLAYLHRAAKSISAEYDICFSTYNELDFSRPGIQYIHHPSFASRKLLHQLHFLDTTNVLDQVPFANFFYRKVTNVISQDRLSGFRQNFTMVNSNFMKEIVEKTFGIKSEVVYPAFLEDDGTCDRLDWRVRDLRFVTIGRVSPDKQHFRVIKDFALLAREFPEADFVIAGRSVDKQHERFLIKKAGELGVRLRLLTDLSRLELKDLLRTSKFYVHSKINEHFGIAIAEAAAMGCLPLAHDSGASKEIVSSPLLLFKSGAELINKAKVLLNDDEERKKVSVVLETGLRRFKTSAFYSRLDEVLGPHL